MGLFYEGEYKALDCLKNIDMHVLNTYNMTKGRYGMKTKDLIKLLEKNGWKFKRHGGNHDVYEKDGKRESIVRHRETDEDLAKAIIRRNGLK